MSTEDMGGGLTASQMQSLKDQLIFDMQMDLKRFRLLLNQICEATDHEDYEAAVETLLTNVKTANARERPAFYAGYREGLADAWTEDDDAEQAWQQYRCQDETDWKVVSKEDAAKIDASVQPDTTQDRQEQK